LIDIVKSVDNVKFGEDYCIRWCWT